MNPRQPYIPGLRAQVAPMGRTTARALRSLPWEVLQPALARFLPARWWAQGPGRRRRVFTLATTFWAFLLQVCRPDSSCREALRQVQATWLAAGKRLSASTGAYCQARLRLPVLWLRRMFQFLGSGGARDWHGLRPLLVDCTHVRLAADTPANRRYRQPPGLAEGCGFPMLKIAALFSLATGRILAFATASLYRHDLPLSRKLWPWLRRGDLLVGDRSFGDFASVAHLVSRGVHVLCRGHQTRDLDLRRGRRLGPSDAILLWRKPSKRPAGFPPARWAALPDFLPVRTLKYTLSGRHLRTRKVTLVTTLLDSDLYSSDALAELYARRWNLELSFRDLKTTLGMDELRGRSPAMVYRELLLFLIFHNLTRRLMHEAASAHQVDFARLSFAGSLASVRQFSVRLVAATSNRQRARLRAEMLRLIASDLVPLRPGRREPRAIKRRLKPFPLLTRPRASYREIPHRSTYHRRKKNTSRKPA